MPLPPLKSLPVRLAAIGECMVELSAKPGNARSYDRRFGGDTLNTATYLARLTAGLAKVSYVTRLGDDALSAAMLTEWEGEGIDCRLVPRLAGRLPGLYMIETSPAGERSFLYWRSQSPAREIFDGDSAALVAALLEMDVLYLSGITVAILPEPGRRVLLDLLAARAGRGLVSAFDNNYRKALWRSAAEARHWMEEVMARCSLLFLSVEDLDAIHNEKLQAARWIDRLAATLQADMVVKDGGFSVVTRTAGVTETFTLARNERPVDTTGAGDSFNAAFLAALLRGASMADAVQAGHLLASRVICHPGAIIARELMP
jgi:2-dehydro-3-deoxygluconokinase